MSKKTKKPSLGRGLDALLSTPTPAQLETRIDENDGELRHLPIEFMQRGKYQPRKDMNAEALEELAESIKVQGLMQPIIVRAVGSDRYEIIAGERRWRACQLAGMETMPVLIREISDQSAIAMALIENIQREDLNPMEEAVALSRLQEEFELTHQEVAQAVGKSRTTVTNLLRLITLTDRVKTMLEHGDLEMGHARSLISLPEQQQVEAANQIVDKGLSVRQAEALVRKLIAAQENTDDASSNIENNPDIEALQEKLSNQLGANVLLKCNARGKGKMVISYNSLDELDGILAHIQ
ncbi:MAG: ParB/RepB/Spo0J family partition protein [Pseudomonadales bacterium]|nr:ParB/RepB/Spo0J family partition protein [Pseudomonadales bacterium]